jgi:transcriptional antiterminator NusG
MNLESTKKESEESSVGNVIPTEFSHERFKWFAVLAQSGMEKRAKSTLEDRIKKLKMENSFGHILIPMMTVEKIDTNGKKKKLEQRMMPGYIFVQMDPENKATFSCVKETPKISKFVVAQANQDPVPVPDDEISRIFNRAAEESKAAPSKPLVAFEKGEKVKVIDGPFTNFIGDIDEVKADKMKLRVLISVFGRATPVELEFTKVEKIKDEE